MAHASNIYQVEIRRYHVSFTTIALICFRVMDIDSTIIFIKGILTAAQDQFDKKTFSPNTDMQEKSAPFLTVHSQIYVYRMDILF